MEKEDARKQSREVLQERRKQVVRLHRKGMQRSVIARYTGLSWSAVDTAIKLYDSGGWTALKAEERGRKEGTGRALSAEQEARVQKLICEKRPEQLKMDFALWTRPAVGTLIQQEFGIELGHRTVGTYLHRWGFTPQKPIKKAYEQCDKAVKQWLDGDYPAIAKRAKEEGAEIQWCDETAIMNTDVRGRSYSPRGQTPITRAVWGQREKFSMISSVTNQGRCHWMMIDGAFNADRLIEFMGHLIKDNERKVYLILDNLRVHHSKPVKAWLDENTTEIEAYYLPSYSPELNPDERLNADIKQAIETKAPSRSRKKLRDTAEAHMKLLENTPDRVIKFFHDKNVRYAANS